MTQHQLKYQQIKRNVEFELVYDVNRTLADYGFACPFPLTCFTSNGISFPLEVEHIINLNLHYIENVMRSISRSL